MTLAGSRKWNKANVDLTGHLIGAMRSISSHWARDFDPDEHPVLESELARTTDEGHKLTPFDLLPGTDPVAGRALEEARDKVEQIRAAFADDPIVSLILDGMRQGMSPPEVRSELGLTQTEYETAMRRLKRKAGKIFPAGGANA